MTGKVTVVDYGMGNIFSVCRALEHEGAQVELASTAGQIRSAERLVLPGVGAFADGMNSLRQGALEDELREYARLGRPFLGICLGMQMMFDSSEEYGSSQGLGLIPGTIRSIPQTSPAGGRVKIPHIGWSPLTEAGHPWADTILKGLKPRDAVYFVHSFAASPAEAAHLLAMTSHEGIPVTAAVRKENLWGCQFHPERSGKVGLAILRNFLEL